MLNIILSLVLGAGLDSLYYYLYISKIKEIKNKQQWKWLTDKLDVRI